MSDHSINYKGIKCAHCGKKNCLHFNEDAPEIFDCAHCGEPNALVTVAQKAARPIGWVCEPGLQGYRPTRFADAEEDIANAKAQIADSQRVLDEAGKEEQKGAKA